MVPPNHPIWIGFSIINHPFWGPTPIFGNPHMNLCFGWGKFHSSRSLRYNQSWEVLYPKAAKFSPIFFCRFWGQIIFKDDLYTTKGQSLVFGPSGYIYIYTRIYKDIIDICTTIFRYTPKFSSSPLKNGGQGRRSFPIGAIGSFSGENSLLNFGSYLRLCDLSLQGNYFPIPGSHYMSSRSMGSILLRFKGREIKHQKQWVSVFQPIWVLWFLHDVT